MNKGVMATGTSRFAWLVVRSPARLVPAPYPQRFALRSSIGSVSFIRMMLHSSHSPNHMKRSHARETWSGATVIDFPEYFSDSRQKNP